MDKRDDRSEESLQQTTVHLHDGLKACGKVIASYRAMFAGETDPASATEPQSVPPEADPAQPPASSRSLASSARTDFKSGS